MDRSEKGMKKTTNMYTSKVLSARVCEPLVKELINMIREGKLRPGEQLPSQEVLSQELGVSRTSLREAIKELSYRGLIYCKHGVGTFVSNSFATELEVLESRKYIETGTAFLAALRASSEELQEVYRLVKAMEENVQKRDFRAFSAQDLEFHRQIAQLSGNHVFQKILQTLGDLVLEQQNTVQQLPGALERANQFHHRILEAISSRNPVAASQLMADHIEDVAGTLKTYYEKGGET
jgi:GntR family transcriptional regulator, transcriptional repressor for pyruvate dehydrogenase complex